MTELKKTKKERKVEADIAVFASTRARRWTG